MTSGYLFAILGLSSFSVLGLLSKFSETKACRPGPTTALMYVWPTVLVSAFAAFFQDAGFRVPLTIPYVAVPFGACGALASLTFLASLRYGKISSSWLIINLSALLPAVLSVVIYKERVGARKGFAVLLAIVALGLVYKDRQLEQAQRKGSEESGSKQASAI